MDQDESLSITVRVRQSRETKYGYMDKLVPLQVAIDLLKEDAKALSVRQTFTGKLLERYFHFVSSA